ncbi:MAG: hypothetical protein K2Y32_11010 [Candidatus Obscuribacterales bacterium]|nr:hypothetical protein [Candidatus Obscuribacterales bacterium]
METLALPLTLKKLTEIECHTPQESNVYWLDRQSLDLLAVRLVALAESISKDASQPKETDLEPISNSVSDSFSDLVPDPTKEALYKRLDYPY